MRLRLLLNVQKPAFIPINYQHHLQALIYHTLTAMDADYANRLHDTGYEPVFDDNLHRWPRRFKLFTFSQLRAQNQRVQGDGIKLFPGLVEWHVSSPLDEFCTNLVSGLFARGEVRIGAAQMTLANMETLRQPDFTSPMRFRCLSPIVSIARDKPAIGSPETHLLPGDPRCSQVLRSIAEGQYRALYGRAPDDGSLEIEFDADYLATHRGTKLVKFKDLSFKGAFAPFVLSGSRELIKVAYECGLGRHTSAGFGMIKTPGGTDDSR